MVIGRNSMAFNPSSTQNDSCCVLCTVYKSVHSHTTVTTKWVTIRVNGFSVARPQHFQFSPPPPPIWFLRSVSCVGWVLAEDFSFSTDALHRILFSRSSEYLLNYGFLLGHH